MPDRRSFLQSLSQIPVVGGLFAARRAAAQPLPRDYFAELGVKPFINAAGTYTMLTASLMPHEVMNAMNYASRHYVRLTELQEAVGKRIAELVGCEAAMVTSGAAGALTIGTAACLTGKDQQKIQRLPDLTGMKSEVLVQKSHRYGYDHAVRACGVRMVEVVTAEDAEAAISDKTAMMLFFNDAEARGKISQADWIALGKKRGVPVFNDAAADVPPLENLSKYLKMGCDLVTFSGGKGICGPQSAGLLLGRRDLIEAARMNTSPNSDSIARGQKVNKEEMLGMLVALEIYVKKDHAAEWKEWERRAAVIADAATKVKSVTHEVVIPEIANHVPHLKLRWDQSRIKLTPQEAMRKLREGDPPIEACPMTNRDALAFGVWMMQPGDAEVVAHRVVELLNAHTV